MPDRHTASTITDDALDALYARLDALEAAAARCPECGDSGACNGGPCPLLPATPAGPSPCDSEGHLLCSNCYSPQAERREQYAAVIRAFEPGRSAAQCQETADAVLAVRDRELDRLREQQAGFFAQMAAAREVTRSCWRRAQEAERAVERVRQWAEGPCPTRPKGFEITGDRACGYVQAMDEIAQLLDGYGPIAALEGQQQEVAP